jgi:hypothetical protein
MLVDQRARRDATRAKIVRGELVEPGAVVVTARRVGADPLVFTVRHATENAALTLVRHRLGLCLGVRLTGLEARCC